MSLLNTLSRLVIAFLPRSNHLLILWLQSPSALILDPKKMKSETVSTFSPSICHEVIGLDAMILVFWMLSFKPAFSLSSFTLIKRLFSSSSLPAIKVVSSACLRLLIFLLAILIPSCNSSTLAFCMMTVLIKVNLAASRRSPLSLAWVQKGVLLTGPCAVTTWHNSGTLATGCVTGGCRANRSWCGFPLTPCLTILRALSSFYPPILHTCLFCSWACGLIWQPQTIMASQATCLASVCPSQSPGRGGIWWISPG